METKRWEGHYLATFNPYAGPMTDIGVHVMTDYMRRVIGGVLESRSRNLMRGEVVSPLPPNDANGGCYYAIT